MVQSVKVATTSSADLAPIGGQMERDFDLITDAVQRTLGAECASIFSEPVSNRDGSRIDWYVPRGKLIKPIAALEDGQADALFDKLTHRQQKIEAHARKLIAGPDPRDRALGKALLNAIAIPDRSHVYSVGGDPVLVAWGYRLANRQAYRGGVSKIVAPDKIRKPEKMPQVIRPLAEETPSEEPAPIAVPVAPSAPPKQESTAPRRHTWWRCLTALLWMLFALLVAIILYLLFTACAISFLPWFDYCERNNTKAQADLAALMQEVRVLENAVALKQQQCAPEREAALSNEEINERLVDRSAGNGALQVSLAWNGLADLDLTIKCTSGAIWFRRPKSCGASLDVDSNGGRHSSNEPVENIVWQEKTTIPQGDLPIFVTLYSHKGQPPRDIPYTIRVVRRDGDQILENTTINGIAHRQQLRQTIRVGSAKNKGSQ